MLSCYLHRRRIGAYLDGVLDPGTARSTSEHLARCASCSVEAESLRSLRVRLRVAATAAAPEWTGFWPGIVRRIEAARRVPAPPRRTAWLRPRWAYGSALAAALIVSLTVWQFLPRPAEREAPVIVRSADSGHPDGRVMVYSTPEQDLTVVWVFGLD